MRFKHKVKKWLEEGIITSEQGEALLNYESGGKKATGWGLYGFLLVAVFSAGLGVIALIAANWKSLPAAGKLAGFFTLLALTAGGALRFKRKSGGEFWFSGLLILFMLLCLAGIGLLSQIYNIDGESHSGPLFWCFITSGLVFFSRTDLSAHLWLAGLYTGAALWAVESLNDTLFYKVTLLHPSAFFLMLMLLRNKSLKKSLPDLSAQKEALSIWTLFSGMTSLIAFHFPRPSGFHITGPDFLFSALAGIAVISAIRFSDLKKIQKNLLTGLWLLFFLFYLTVFPAKPNSLILMIFSVLILSLLALIFAASRKKALFLFWTTALICRILLFYITFFTNLSVAGVALHFLGFLFALMILYSKGPKGLLPAAAVKRKTVLEGTLIFGLAGLIAFHFPPPVNFLITGAEFFFSVFTGAVAVCAVWFSDLKKIQKNLLTGLWLLFFLFYLTVFPAKPNSLILMIFSVLILSLLALIFASGRQKSLFLFITASLIFRILLFYITVFKSLTVTGIVLILLSLVVFATVQTAKKHKVKLLQWIEGLE